MPPKKRNIAAEKTASRIEDKSDVIPEDSHTSDQNDEVRSDLESFLDRRLQQQTKSINEMFEKFTTSTKSDLDDIKASQVFISSKFDELANSVDILKAENHELRSQNESFKKRIDNLEGYVTTLDVDLESLREYTRRDMLEIHGVPISTGENTNEIIIAIGQLLGANIKESDISISHRLSAREGFIAPIIVKFSRRDIRNAMLSKKSNLRNKSSLDLGLNEEVKIYLNESLTQRGRSLLRAVRAFKRDFNFKFVWTANGKVFLRKNNSQESRVYSFSSIKEFDEFKLVTRN
jgi:hypothetical protein